MSEDEDFVARHEERQRQINAEFEAAGAAMTLPAALRNGVGINQIARTASRQLAASNDVREVRELAEQLESFATIVAETTRNRNAINQIAAPMLDSVVKAGRMLRAMAENGQRQHRGGNRRGSNSRRDSLVPSLRQLGFSWSRASRWQLAAQLPDCEREKYQAEVLASDDGILTIAGLVRAAEVWLLGHRLDPDAPSTWRQKLRSGGKAVIKEVTKPETIARAYNMMANQQPEQKLQLMLALAMDLRAANICFTDPHPFGEPWHPIQEGDELIPGWDLQEGETGFVIERGYWTLILALMEGEQSVQGVLEQLMALPFDKHRSFLENLMAGKSIAAADLIAVRPRHQVRD